ncbi:MAG: protein kinase [Candidatus Promineifilaceae bacterium]
MTNLIGRQLDNYRIDALLGEGGMGSVYRAYDVNLARPVAVKVMHPQFANQSVFRQRFLQEAQAAARLSDHTSIVNIYDFGLEADNLFMVMEFVPGASLGVFVSRLQDQNRVVKLSETLLILAQVADALGYAHRRGVVHRDVKPDNILLRPLEEPDRPGELPIRAVVTDFGLAKLLEGGVQTQTGTFMGTLPYMSPEQCMGRELDGRSDIYSLGVILYLLSTGQLPFDIKSPTDAVMKHMNAVPPNPTDVRPGLPVSVENIIKTAIAKAPGQRFQRGEDMAEALRQAASGLTDEDVTRFAPPQSIVSLATQLLPAGYKAEPSRLGFDMTALPGEERLLIAQSGESPESVTLEKDNYTIGRSSTNDIVLTGEGISRNHLRIERTPDGGWRVVDLGSTNGSFLGDNRLLPDIPERWEPGQALRIGLYAINLQKIDRPAGPLGVPAAGAAGTYLATEQSPRPAFNVPGQLGLVINPSNIDVTPGNRADIQVELLNQGSTVGHFIVSVEGLYPEWVTVPNHALQLLPGASGALPLTIHVPRESRATADQRHFQVVIRREGDSHPLTTADCQLTIQPFSQFSMDMRPLRLQSGGVCRVLVKNEGNTPMSFGISGRDPAESITFLAAGSPASPGSLTVGPGERETMDLQIKAKERPLIGSTRTVPFEVHVRPANGQQQTMAGQLDVGPVLPRWLIPLALILMIVLCLTTGGLLTFFNNQNTRATETAQAVTAEFIAAQTTEEVLAGIAAQETEEAFQATSAAATATAEQAALLGDNDSDGLTNSKEAELLTDPDNPDSDNDGLTDGEEVNQYGTDPLDDDSDDDGLLDGEEINDYQSSPNNPDSDGDGLTDGEEVNDHGTDPTEPDTDGDGLNDAVEISNGTDPLDPNDPAPTPTVTPTPTETPTPTATATPAPPEPSLLVYATDQGLFAMTLDLVDGELQAGITNKLTDGDGITSVKISPDGQKVAYLQLLINNNNQLFVINIDGTGSQHIADSGELSQEPISGADPTLTRRIVGDFQWLSDSQRLAYNTRTIGTVGPGLQLNQDLYVSDLNGNIVVSHPPNTVGGTFDISNNDQVVMATTIEVMRMDLDGGNRQTVITFPPVATYSEYAYYPQPQWLPDGSAAFVTVSGPDPILGDQDATYWEIPTVGTAELLNTVNSNLLMDRIYPSPNGNETAFVRLISNPSNPPRDLMLGNGQAGNVQTYGASADQLQIYGWSSNSQSFLYRSQDGSNFGYHVGRLGQAPVNTALPAGQTAVNPLWVTDSTFVLALGSSNNWRISSANLDGDEQVLVNVAATQAVFDAWPPTP